MNTDSTEPIDDTPRSAPRPSAPCPRLGNGKTAGGRPSVTPWGWPTKGGYKTRTSKKYSQRLIEREGPRAYVCAAANSDFDPVAIDLVVFFSRLPCLCEGTVLVAVADAWPMRFRPSPRAFEAR
eukprot:CAMPEP_0179915368 /NCGR_PEP_ID=MMETSP0983-20121128/1626_1 /TAXON_ID=483367 /ORGANISM="non described non described, Strain CCMP 2436" /LENGTH=123 /DNA_ID=CAMNT_0021817759 /DNA_START=512 /DNA_END=884 /DNA_ORIENTATION=-